MAEMGFGDLRLLRTFQVHLAGSQRQLNAYIFVKPSHGTAAAAAAAAAVAAAARTAAAGAAAAGAEAAAASAARKQAVAPTRCGGKRGAAAAAAAAGPDDAASDASCDTQLSLPLEQWMRVNRLRADASGSSEATSQRVRRKRRLS
jgi:hypothetical protein